jgi:tRNA pseudouridine38-40 synthase
VVSSDEDRIGDVRNIALVIEYNGARFAGWQVQPGQRTVQQSITDAIAAVTGEAVKLIGSGRTDSGVHAEGQVANFKTQSSIKTSRFPAAINSHLAADAAVIEARDVPPDFHARHDAVGKTYRYTISTRAVKPVFSRELAVWVPRAMDVAAMREAAAHLVGTHDFNSFRAQGKIDKDAVRTIERIDIDEDDNVLRMYFAGTGFLYMMVRIIVGTLVEVGWGQRAPGDMPGVIEARRRGAAGHTAPPEGLCLIEVRY